MLQPCPTCTRHVRSTESRCPFCSTALPDGFGGSRAVLPSGGRLTRAAILFASATTVAACGGQTDGPSEGSSSSGSSGMGVPVYGVPEIDSGSEEIVDAGPADAGDAADGGDADAGGSVALYGPAPIDGG